MSNAKAVILSCAGTSLSASERDFFRDANPHGFILYSRNIETPDQIRGLIADLRDAVGRDDAPMLLDQEGGRVQRLKPPLWPCVPAAAEFGRLAQSKLSRGVKATRIAGQLIGVMLADLGFTVACAPVLDVLTSATDNHLGDRCYSADPLVVSALVEAFCEGLLSAGVAPTLKHPPAYGHVTKDSHFELPVINTWYGDMKERDFLPYQHIAAQDWGRAAWAMPAHAVYSDIDDQHPATCSRRVLGDIIRGDIGFEGPIVADDIAMNALSGSAGDRARTTVQAGCDLALYSQGIMEAMVDIADKTPKIDEEGENRLKQSENLRKLSRRGEMDIEELTARLGAALEITEVAYNDDTDPTASVSGG